MPLCWIFLLKRRRALSNVSFSPTRTSANRVITSHGRESSRDAGPAEPGSGPRSRPATTPAVREPPESSRGQSAGQTSSTAGDGRDHVDRRAGPDGRGERGRLAVHPDVAVIAQRGARVAES